MTRRTIEELAANAEALAASFENFDPTPAGRDAPLPPVMEVRLAAYRRDAAEAELANAIGHARELKVSWRELGDAIGTSGEAARQRYSRSRA